MSSKFDIRDDPLDASTSAFLQALADMGDPPLYHLPPEKARAWFQNIQAGNFNNLPTAYEDLTIPAGPTGALLIRIIRPRRAYSPLPVVMYFHGGWVLGDRFTHDRLVREIAHNAQVAVVFVEYLRAPEAHYPLIIEQAYSATRWVVENASSLGLDASRLAVAGDATGANLATVVAILAKQRCGPKIDLQVLFAPLTDATSFDTPSYQQFASGFFFSREEMRWFVNHYAPDAAERRHATISPLHASLEELKGLPPALLITGECDILRDEGEAYAHKLMAAGVPVTAMRCLGAIHQFVLLNPIMYTPAPRAAVALANSLLRTVFTGR